MSDPYELYAKRILGLRPLEALDADPGALERGIIVHRALERFVKQHPRELPADAEQQLLRLGREVFAPYAHRPRVQAVWWPRFLEVVRWVVAQEAARRPGLVEVIAEVTGELEIAAPGGPFVLVARADRLERHADGRITVIDYKTGQLPQEQATCWRAGTRSCRSRPRWSRPAPSRRSVARRGRRAAVLAPLRATRRAASRSAAVARAGAGRARRRGARRARACWSRTTTAPETAYPARPRPRVGPRRDYDHLARRGEWLA